MKEKEGGKVKMNLNSTYTDLGTIVLPRWQDRQKYMHTFNPQFPVMAKGYEDYLEPAVALCQAAEALTGDIIREAHMTVDEKIVQPGMSQRRPGAHVDGCFVPSLQSWTHPTWAHYCNNLPLDRMAIIVAASVPGCIVYDGNFEGQPASDGDLEHIRDQLGDGYLLPANRGYLLSPDCVHESMVFQAPTKRTFLRVAFHDAVTTKEQDA